MAALIFVSLVLGSGTSLHCETTDTYIQGAILDVQPHSSSQFPHRRQLFCHFKQRPHWRSYKGEGHVPPRSPFSYSK